MGSMKFYRYLFGFLFLSSVGLSIFSIQMEDSVIGGKVRKIPQEQVRTGKYASVQHMLVVEFDNGMTKAIEVTPTFYYTTELNKRVFVKMGASEFGDYFYQILFIISFCASVITFFCWVYFILPHD